MKINPALILKLFFYQAPLCSPNRKPPTALITGNDNGHGPLYSCKFCQKKCDSSTMTVYAYTLLLCGQFDASCLPSWHRCVCCSFHSHFHPFNYFPFSLFQGRFRDNKGDFIIGHTYFPRDDGYCCEAEYNSHSLKAETHTTCEILVTRSCWIRMLNIDR